MSAEAFDLGLRFRAAHTGTVAPKLHHTTVPATPHPVAVRATATPTTVTVTACAPGQNPRTATGDAALDLLGTLGVTIDAPSPAQIITDTTATYRALAQLARTAPRTGDRAAVAAHLAWTLDRNDFPDSRAGYLLTTACRARWVTGQAPDTESTPATWRAWLHLGDGIASLHDAHTLLTTGVPLPLLDDLWESATYSWIAAQNRHANGIDWRIPDTPGRAAVALFDRCTAAELFAAALMDDPLWRMRAVHTGHIATGTLHPEPITTAGARRRATLHCTRLDARLTAGTACTGWYGPAEADAQPLAATLESTNADTALKLHLSFGKSASLTPGTFTLREAAPNRRQNFTRRRNLAHLFALRRSWLTTGRQPLPARREVPLDVLVAGADPEQD